MKVRFFLDIWPGLLPEHHSMLATTRPAKKTDGVRRVAFDVEIPDHLFTEEDIRLIDEVPAQEIHDEEEG